MMEQIDEEEVTITNLQNKPRRHQNTTKLVSLKSSDEYSSQNENMLSITSLKDSDSKNAPRRKTF